MKKLEEEKGLLEEVVQKLVDEKDDLSSQQENVDLITRELKDRITELEGIVEQNQERLNVSYANSFNLCQINVCVLNFDRLHKRQR